MNPSTKHAESLAVQPGIRMSELSFFSPRGHRLSELVSQRKGEIGAEGWLRLGRLAWSLNQPGNSLTGHRAESPRCTLTGRAGCTLEAWCWQLIYGFTFARPVLWKLCISRSGPLRRARSRGSCPVQQVFAVVNVCNYCSLSTAVST